MDNRLALLLGGKVEPPPQPEIDPKIPLPRVAAFYGVTGRTVARWRKRPELGFPEPEKINGRNYLRLSQLLAWDESRAQAETGTDHD